MDSPRDNPILHYQKPPPIHYGCGLLFLETLGGLLLSVAAFFTARSIVGWCGPGFALLIVLCVFGLFLGFTIFPAYKRHPGFMVGFIIGSSWVALMITACGIGSIF